MPPFIHITELSFCMEHPKAKMSALFDVKALPGSSSCVSSDLGFLTERNILNVLGGMIPAVFYCLCGVQIQEQTQTLNLTIGY